MGRDSFGQEQGVGGPGVSSQYLQEHLSPQPALEVPEAQVSPEFRWAQRHRPDLSPPEIPEVGQENGSFQRLSNCMGAIS